MGGTFPANERAAKSIAYLSLECPSKILDMTVKERLHISQDHIIYLFIFFFLHFCFSKMILLTNLRIEHIQSLALDPGLIWLIAFIQISGDMATEHINGNGPEEPMDTTAAVTHSEHFQTLLEAGLPQKVAEKLDEIYIAGKAL